MEFLQTSIYFLVSNLALDTASRYTLHNILTKENKYQEQRNRYHRYGSHLNGIVYEVCLPLNAERGVTQSVCDKLMRGFCNKVWPDIRVPRAHHFQYSDRDKVWQGERYHYLPQILEVLRTVNLCGEVKLVWYLHEVLAKKEDIEYADKEWNNKCCK